MQKTYKDITLFWSTLLPLFAYTQTHTHGRRMGHSPNAAQLLQFYHFLHTSLSTDTCTFLLFRSHRKWVFLVHNWKMNSYIYFSIPVHFTYMYYDMKRMLRNSWNRNEPFVFSCVIAVKKRNEFHAWEMDSEWFGWYIFLSFFLMSLNFVCFWGIFFYSSSCLWCLFVDKDRK